MSIFSVPLYKVFLLTKVTSLFTRHIAMLTASIGSVAATKSYVHVHAFRMCLFALPRLLGLAK